MVSRDVKSDMTWYMQVGEAIAQTAAQCKWQHRQLRAAAQGRDTDAPAPNAPSNVNIDSGVHCDSEDDVWRRSVFVPPTLDQKSGRGLGAVMSLALSKVSRLSAILSPRPGVEAVAETCDEVGVAKVCGMWRERRLRAGEVRRCATLTGRDEESDVTSDDLASNDDSDTQVDETDTQVHETLQTPTTGDNC